jgi:hypothetical protein
VKIPLSRHASMEYCYPSRTVVKFAISERYVGFLHRKGLERSLVKKDTPSTSMATRH